MPDPRASTAFRALLVFLAALAYFLFFHSYSFFLQDEGVIAYQALRVTQGQVPYANFQTAYPPAVYYLHALLFKLFGPQLAVLRLSGSVACALTAAVLWVAATRVVPAPYAFLPSLLYVILEDQESRGFVVHTIPYPTRYVEVLWALSLCLTLAHSRQPRRLLVVVLGLATAAIISFKHTAGIYNAWAAGLSLILIGWEHGSSTPAPGQVCEPGAGRRFAASLLRAVPLLFLLAVLGALTLLLGSLSGTAGALLLVWYLPVAALVLLLAWHLSRRARAAEAEARRLAALARMGADLCAFAVAALLPTALWVTYFAVAAGPRLLLQRLVLDGPQVARSYAIAFPPPGVLAAAAGLIVAVAAGGHALVRRGSVAGRTAARGLAWTAGVVTGIALVWEGTPLGPPLRAGQWDVATLHVGRDLDSLVIYLVPVIAYAFLIRLGTWLRRGGCLDLTLLCWTHGMCALFLAFPRMDIAHVYQGVLLLLIPGTVLLFRTIRFFRAAAAPGRARWLPFAVACALAALGFVKLLPRLEVQLAWQDGLRLESRTRLAGPGDGLYETGEQGGWFSAVNRVVAFVAARTTPETPIFAYPALPGFYLLSGRPNPSGIDYFYRGFGEGRDEVAVIKALEETQTPLVVVMTDHAFDPEDEGHFPILKDYLRRHYLQTEYFAPFRLLERMAP